MTTSGPEPSLQAQKIVFAGTPAFAATALLNLLANKLNIAAVFTQPDRPAGRGKKLSQSHVKKLALKHGLPVFQPLNFKHEQDVAALRALKPDVMVVAAYGIILPESVLTIPRVGCINIHASLLPRWRGAAPIQRALEAGDKETGISIMQMEAGLDTGPVLLKKTTVINNGDTGASLHDRLADLGGHAIVEALRHYHNLSPKVQDDSLATYARRLSKADGEVNWYQPATVVERTLRAFSPWPGCYSTINDTRIKIHEADVLTQMPEPALTPGTVVECSAKGIQVACGEGGINITRLQLPGARAMQVADFVNGNQHKLLLNRIFNTNKL